ncbi:MAG: YibE/F family protein [Eubacteriales bacterium]|jgi:uncharacterized membrane protein|nr:YibE/F family protein [Eubacteriales bacterium]
MKSLSRKNILSYIGVIIFAVLFIFIGNKILKPEVLEQEQNVFQKAKVISIDSIETEDINFGDDNHEIKKITFTAKITSKEYKDQTVQVLQEINPMYAMQPKEVKKGSKIILVAIAADESGELEWFFSDHNRSDILFWLVVLFLLIVLIIGRGKGLTAILSLAITIAAIFTVFIPSILKGYSIYASTMVIGVFVVFVSLIILNGLNKKTACAILGNIGGLAVAGAFAFLMNKILNVTGIVDEEYVFLMSAQFEKPINLVALVWSGIVIGALGAIMDVAMSIASAINELAENMQDKTFGKLLKSGMNIGRDAIGTMTNTLVLAYVGSSLATILLLMVYSKDTLFLFNMEMIAIEILQSVVGSLGILFAVPATSIFSAYIYTKKESQVDFLMEKTQPQ